jgi:hypothetical protein
MDTKDLITKLLGHVFDHFLDSSLLEGPLIERNGFQALECQSENAGFPILNPLLAVGVGLEILFKLLLLLQVISLPFVM